MLSARSVRGSLSIGMCLAMLAACDGAVRPVVDASRCEAPNYAAVLTKDINEVQVWAGNQTAMAPGPLLISQDKTKIGAIAQFFLERSDGWYIGAGETHDPASRRSGSNFTLRFLSQGRQAAYIGWSYTYLETPGCGVELIRSFAPTDIPLLMHVVFDVPLTR